MQEDSGYGVKVSGEMDRVWLCLPYHSAGPRLSLIFTLTQLSSVMSMIPTEGCVWLASCA